MVINIVSLNVKGIQEKYKRRAIFEKYRKICQILCLQETHSTEKCETQWSNEWGGKIFFCHGDSNSRGVAVLLHPKLDVDISQIQRCTEGRKISCNMMIDNYFFALTVIYAPNKDCPEFFVSVLNEENLATDRIIIGDFNVALNYKLDRKSDCNKDLKPKSTAQLEQLMNEFCLIDVWRSRNPECKRFSWFKPKESKIASRIDYALTSPSVAACTHDTFYTTGIYTDHSAFFIGLDPYPIERGNGYWKMNTDLLCKREYLDFMNNILEQKILEYIKLKPKVAWENLKKDIKQYSIKFSKQLASQTRERIANLSEEICEMEKSFDVISEADFKHLQNLKAEFEDINHQFIKGVVFRSGCKWYEEGEKNSKYFYSLEKRNYKAKTCYTLFKDSQHSSTTSDPAEILKLQHNFYQELYKHDDMVVFEINDPPPNVISEEMSNSMAEKISKEEVATAVKLLKNQKCPGPDGIPVDFYKVFWSKIAELFFQVIEDCKEDKEMHQSATRGILNLIPKKDRDTRILKNLRPITLLNTDYKIVEKILVNRMMPALDIIIDPDQKGFMPGRRISSNIRKIMDIVKAAEIEDIPALIVQADIAKAFDKVAMCAILGAFRYFNFPEFFCEWFSILYKNFFVRVQNNGFFSDRIHIQRSVHQGAPASAAIFICVAELLAISLRNNNSVRGVYVQDIYQLLNQYADDTDTCLDGSDESSLNATLDTFNKFAQSTGCALNYEKTSVYRIGSLRNSKALFYTASKLHWEENRISVLGIEVSNNDQKDLINNYSHITEKAKAVLRSWRRRTLSLIGKISVINTLVIPLFIHSMMVLPPIPEKVVTEIEAEFETFIWNGHKPKIPITALKQKRCNGGLNLTDLRIKDEALKCSWVRIIFDDQQVAKYAEYFIKSGVGYHLWSCNLHWNDILIFGDQRKIGGFWYSVLKSWCKFNFAEDLNYDHRIWFNSLFRIDDKPYYMPHAVKNGLFHVSDLYENGVVIGAEKAQVMYQLTTMEYNSILSSIPKAKKSFIKNQLAGEKVSSSMDVEKLASFLLSNQTTKLVYNERAPVVRVKNKCAQWEKDISRVLSDVEFRNLCKNCYYLTNVPKYRSFQYRLLHRAVVTNIQLKHWNLKAEDLCSFCDMERETYKHFFATCHVSKSVWKIAEDIICELSGCLSNQISCGVENILLCTVNSNPAHISNFICVIYKQFLYSCRCRKLRPNPGNFKNIVNHIKNMENYIAVRNGKITQFNKKWNCTKTNVSETEGVIDIQSVIDEYIENL